MYFLIKSTPFHFTNKTLGIFLGLVPKLVGSQYKLIITPDDISCVFGPGSVNDTQPYHLSLTLHSFCESWEILVIVSVCLSFCHSVKLPQPPLRIHIIGGSGGCRYCTVLYCAVLYIVSKSRYQLVTINLRKKSLSFCIYKF